LLPGREDQPESFCTLQTEPTHRSITSLSTTTIVLDNNDEASSRSSFFDNVTDFEEDLFVMEHKHNNNYTLMELVQLWPAWLLLWIGMILVGGGTMMTNNMAQMVESLSLWPLETVTSASMSIFSVAQAISRIVTGAWSDYALVHYDLPRPAFFILASLVGIVSHAILAMTPWQSQFVFLVGVALAGAAFGIIWPLMVLLVGEIRASCEANSHLIIKEQGATNQHMMMGSRIGQGQLLWLLVVPFLFVPSCHAWVAPAPLGIQQRPCSHKKPTDLCMAKRARGFGGGSSTDEALTAGFTKKSRGKKTSGKSSTSSPLVQEEKSIQDVLNPRYKDPEVLSDIRARLKAGQVVILKDAFLPEIAEAMHSELESTDMWDHNEDYFADGYHFKHQNIYDKSDFPPICTDMSKNIFESTATKEFMTELSGRDCRGENPGGAPSYYGPGDHSLPHTDHIGQRSVAYVWHLSKNWKPEWGGALYWAQEPLANAFHHASFNSLCLFSVTPHTVSL